MLQLSSTWPLTLRLLLFAGLPLVALFCPSPAAPPELHPEAIQITVMAKKVIKLIFTASLLNGQVALWYWLSVKAGHS